MSAMPKEGGSLHFRCRIFIVGRIIDRLSICHTHVFARTPLHSAAYSGNVAGLQLLIDQGAEVNSVDQRGCSALMVAAERGQTRAVGVWGKKEGKSS